MKKIFLFIILLLVSFNVYAENIIDTSVPAGTQQIQVPTGGNPEEAYDGKRTNETILINPATGKTRTLNNYEQGQKIQKQNGTPVIVDSNKGPTLEIKNPTLDNYCKKRFDKKASGGILTYDGGICDGRSANKSHSTGGYEALIKTANDVIH